MCPDEVYGMGGGGAALAGVGPAVARCRIISGVSLPGLTLFEELHDFLREEDGVGVLVDPPIKTRALLAHGQ